MRETILKVVTIMTSIPDATEGDLVDELVRRLDISEFRAELFATIVPLAFGRAVIARLKLTAPIVLSDTARIYSFDTDQVWEVPLDHIPEYVVACQLAEEAYATNIISHDQFLAVSLDSAEINALNQLLRDGGDPSGAVVSPPGFLRLADLPEFERWYQEVSR